MYIISFNDHTHDSKKLNNVPKAAPQSEVKVGFEQDSGSTTPASAALSEENEQQKAENQKTSKTADHTVSPRMPANGPS